MVQYFKRKETQYEKARSKTRRGRLQTTIPRLIQVDIHKVINVEQRKQLFGTDDFTNGTNLQVLKLKAQKQSSLGQDNENTNKVRRNDMGKQKPRKSE